MKLQCGACGKVEKVHPGQWDGAPWYICGECHRLAEEWAEESKRIKRELAEECLARPRYAMARALLTYEPARLAAKVSPSAD